MNRNVNFENDIHSCGYHCDKPACVKAQRDELRDKYFLQFERPNPLYIHGWNAALDEAAQGITSGYSTKKGN